MQVNLDSIGKKHGPVEFSYGFKDVILYALGVGATPDQLQFIFEGHPEFSVLPTFATIPITPLMFDAINEINADLTRLLHGFQEVTLYQPIPTQGTLKTWWWVDAIYDKGKSALAILKAKSYVGEEEIFENIVGLFLRGQGGFGGDRGPKTELALPPEGKEPDISSSYKTMPIQSYLYRLNGDYNPLHASYEFAQMAGFERPILHGLCTFGIAVREFIVNAMKGDVTKIKKVKTRFSGVVYPEDTITTNAWKRDKNTYVLIAKTDRNVDALTDFVIQTNE